MAYFSHSKISTFEQCKFKYKLQYIDKVKVEIPTTIEAFMGSMVHESLEYLYNELIHKGAILRKKELVKHFLTNWTKEFSSKILIVNKNFNAEDYKNQGVLLLLNYYDSHKPFNQFKTIATETQDRIKLGPDYYHIRIDRLDTNMRGLYLVCDYKTSSRMKTKKEVENDRQLFMYSLWIKEKFDDVKKVKLLWHMLKFDKDIIQDVDYSKADEVKNQVMNRIKEIKNAKEFPATPSILCKWCVYKDICPYYNKNVTLDDLNEFIKKSKGRKITPSKNKEINIIKKINLDSTNLNSATTIQNKLKRFF